MMKTRYRVAIGSDHGGYEVKKNLIRYLQSLGHDVRDLGCHSTESYDFPISASDVARAVASKSCDRGVVIDGAGSPSATVANKFPGIRASVVHNEFTATISREHSDANIIAFGAKVIDAETARKLLELWLRTDFLGGKYQKRLDLISDIEREAASRGGVRRFVTAEDVRREKDLVVSDETRVTPLARELLEKRTK